MLRRSLIGLVCPSLPTGLPAQENDADTIRMLRAASNEAIARHDVPGPRWAGSLGRWWITRRRGRIQGGPPLS